MFFLGYPNCRPFIVVDTFMRPHPFEGGFSGDMETFRNYLKQVRFLNKVGFAQDIRICAHTCRPLSNRMPTATGPRSDALDQE